MLAPWKKINDKPRQCTKKQKHYFANKGLSSQSCGFSNMFMYGCESWTIKKAECVRIHAFELWRWKRLLRVPWDARRSNQSILKEISLDYSSEGTDAETEAPIIFWPPDVKNWLTGKDPDARKDWRQEKGMTDEMVGWHHWLNGHEFEQALGDGEGQRSLACCMQSMGSELDTTEQLNWTEASTRG